VTAVVPQNIVMSLFHLILSHVIVQLVQLHLCDCLLFAWHRAGQTLGFSGGGLVF
jgi:hypothetical protein